MRSERGGDFGELRHPLGQGLAGAEHRRVGLHGALHAVADHRGRGVAVGVAQTVEVGQRAVAGVGCQLLVRGVRLDRLAAARSEERGVGKDGVSTCKSRWWPYSEKKKRVLRLTL